MSKQAPQISDEPTVYHVGFSNAACPAAAPATRFDNALELRLTIFGRGLLAVRHKASNVRYAVCRPAN